MVYFTNRYRQLHALVRTLFEHGVDRGEIEPDVEIDDEVAALLAHLDGARLVWLYDGQQPGALTRDVATYVDQLVARIAARG